MSYKIVTLKKLHTVTSNFEIYKEIHKLLFLAINYNWNTLEERMKTVLAADYKTSSEKIKLEEINGDSNSKLKFGETQIEWIQRFTDNNKSSKYIFSQTGIPYTLIDKFGDKILVAEVGPMNNGVFENTFIVQLSEDLYINTYKENEK